MSQPAPGELWALSLRLYSHPGVSQACLALQESCGADVNVLLFLLWLAQQGVAVSKPELETILQSSEAWRAEVVVPLRRIRRRLKQPVALVSADEALAYRERIKAVELEAERLQLEALQALFVQRPIGSCAPESAAAARTSLEAYAAALAQEFPEPVMGELLTALAMARPA